MNHFTPTMTREQIRTQYHTLAFLFHPDMGGKTEDMQVLNAEYDLAMDAATRREMPERSEGSYTHQAMTNERIRKAIEVAMQFRQLKVEVTGWWVWVTGTAKGDACIAVLKEAGYKWSPKRGAWYFAGIPSKNRKEWSMDRIRATHGSTEFEHPELVALA